MTQYKHIAKATLLMTVMISISACGAKRFNSDEASSVRSDSGSPTPGGGGQTPGGDNTNPADFLTTDQCFLIYDVWGINNPHALNSSPWTSDADCAQISATSVTMNFGVPQAASYSLYHLTPAQTQALVSQVTNVAQPTDATVGAMDPNLFKQALVGSTLKPFTHVVGYYDDYL